MLDWEPYLFDASFPVMGKVRILTNNKGSPVKICKILNKQLFEIVQQCLTKHKTHFKSSY